MNTVNTDKSRTKLSYRKNRFILTTEKDVYRRLLTKNSSWQMSPTGYEFKTRNLGAAAVFRKYATENVEKIFKRTFQEFYPHVILPMPRGLDPHQREGLEWILSRKRSYLAHAPGAGKTAQAICAALMCRLHRSHRCEPHKDLGQILLIVPPSLTKNWEREIYKFTEWFADYGYPFPTVGIVPRSDKQERMAWKADFIICPDSMLTRPWVYDRLLHMNKRFIAVDEASRFKEFGAERTAALFGGKSGDTVYAGLVGDAAHVVLMDGSPMPNRPIELWAPTYAMDPGSIDYMGYEAFGYHYCGAKQNQYGQWEFLYSSNEQELKEKLQKSFMHVVSEDRLSHPERRRSLLYMNEDVRTAEHKKWESANLGKIELSEDASQGDLARYRRELGVRKVPWVARYVEDRLKDKNESILLFAWHRDVCLALHAALSKEDRPAGLVIGGTSPKMREGLFDLFQKGEIKLLIMNIAAAGRGHNLQRADRVIFAEWSWTDEMNRQCEKRASRRGNERAFVRCEYLVCPGSMDELVLTSVFSKERRVKKIIG